MGYVSYFRVSTKRQGESGLGLDAQKAVVHTFLRGVQPVAEFIEVESGRKDHDGRPELSKAIEACRLFRARLLVAKLDRLARNASFLHRLRDSGIEFVCCDMPDANHLTVGILALVAEDEARRISERTKAALAVARRRGTPLGNPGNLSRHAEGRRLGTLVRVERARNRAREILPTVTKLVKEGRSLRAVALHLSAMGVPTARGGKWTAGRVADAIRYAVGCSSDSPSKALHGS